MKANELRIGNYINYRIVDKLDERQEWDEVSIIDGQDLDYLEKNPNDKDFQPIPLTEEWLLKFGIDFTSEKEWYQLTFTIKGLLFETASSMEGFTYNLCFDDMINIKYVHQLQNLYFALTGEELK